MANVEQEIKRQNLVFGDLELGNGFFLSKTNPIATVDQRDMEQLGLEILEMPQVQAGKAKAAQRWRTIAGRDITGEAERRFDELVEEWAFNYVMKAVNSDANYPKVLGHNYGPPHEWFGMKVPGTRGSGGDGPDQNYSIIPIDGQARFKLVGRYFDRQLGDAPFTLTGNLSLSMTLNQIDWQDMVINDDGGFVVTLDPEPANGRANHIQTCIDARWLFIRDCRSDWRKTVNAYRVERLDPPTAPPLTITQLADRAARFMVDDVPAMYWFIRTLYVLEPNTVTTPFETGGIGGLVSQQISFMRLQLADDEAFVVTFGSGGAPFRDVVLHDYWFRTFPYWQYTTCFNNAQGVANPDGSTTYVISHRDPGVHNWLNTLGFRHLLALHRWQGLTSGQGAEGKPWAEGRLVKVDGLERVLPKGMRRVTPEQRQQQLKERAEQFQLRYLDH